MVMAASLSGTAPPAIDDVCPDVATYAAAAAESRIAGEPWQSVHARDLIAAKGNLRELRRREVAMRIGYTDLSSADAAAVAFILCDKHRLDIPYER